MLNNNHENDLIQLLDRYLAGECSKSEKETLEEFLSARPYRGPLLEYFLDQLEVSGPPGSAIDRSLAELLARVDQEDGEQIADRIDTSHNRFQRETRLPIHFPFGRNLGKAMLSASALIAVLAIVLFPQFDFGNGKTAENPGMVYTTTWGQRLSITLPDGSRVTLGPETRLSLSDSYGGNAREVTLSGAAYFDVIDNAVLPFSVKTQDAITSVLGTEFTVESYPEDSATAVIVKSGRVNLSGAGILASGDKGIVHRSGVHTFVSDVDVYEAQSWAEGRLIFNGVIVSEVLRQLERWYGIQVEIPDTHILSNEISITFEKEGSKEIIESLALLLNCKVETHSHNQFRLIPVK